MREQLRLLEGLQKVDLRLQDTEKELQELPARLESMKDDVGSVETMLEGERQKLAEVEGYRAELQQTISADQDRLAKTKTKLNSVRSSKEYMAVQREFETNRRLIGEREEEIAKLNAAIEANQQSIGQHEQELAELHQHIVEEEEATRVRLGELEQQAAEQRAERESTSESVGKILLRKYDQIRRLRGGISVVAAVSGVCGGCRMHLPPQLYNTLQRANTIEQCPTCQRIVYYPEDDEVEAEEAPSAPS